MIDINALLNAAFEAHTAKVVGDATEALRERIASLENQVNVLVGQVAGVNKDAMREIATEVVIEHESEYDHDLFISDESEIGRAVNEAINNLTFEVTVS